jgi:microtubule-associated protein-like 6
MLYQVLDEGANLRPLHSCRDCKEGVSDLKYSPNNRFLAAATFDTWIDVY